MKKHYHFCPSCGYCVVCGAKERCLYLKWGEKCTNCGGTWKRAEAKERSHA